MADLIYLALTLAFFALCVAYVRGLDRLVQSSATPVAEDETAP